MRKVETEKSIRQIVRGSVESYAKGFEARHVGEIGNPNGVINMKIHNVFIFQAPGLKPSPLGEQL